jgi:hypothetical protein
VKNLFYILIPILAFLAYWFFFRKKSEGPGSEGSGSEKEWKQQTSDVKVSKQDFLNYLSIEQSTVQGQTYYFSRYQLEHRNDSGLTVIDAIKSGYRQIVMASKKKGEDLFLTDDILLLTEEIKECYIDAVANRYKKCGDACSAVVAGKWDVKSYING